MLELLTDPSAWASLLTLTILEIVLGIDNIVFLSIISGDLPPERRVMARQVGLGMALVMRIGLLFTITLIAQSVEPLFNIGSFEVSGRDIIMFGGGLFLLWKGAKEIAVMLKGEDEETSRGSKKVTVLSVIIQIALIDLVFSLDSIITAVGVSGNLPIMIAAIVIAIGIMLFASNTVSDFINERPSIKMLALGFILLVGITLVANGLHHHIPHGYLYCAIGFSLIVEMLNLKAAQARGKHMAVIETDHKGHAGGQR